MGKSVRPLTVGALGRREEWASRAEAERGFAGKPFFQAWDERVLGRYVEFGLREGEGGAVALKTKAKHEAVSLPISSTLPHQAPLTVFHAVSPPQLVFADPACHASRRAHARLTALRADLPVHFILADVGRSVLPEIGIAALLGQVPHATHTRVEGAGHLVAQERPGEVGRVVGDCLGRWFGRAGGARAKL